MRNYAFLWTLVCLSAVLFCCKEKRKDACGGCPEGQTCIGNAYDNCIQNDWLYEINGQKVVVTNGFVGVATNACFDTIIFYEDTLRTGDLRFGLVAAIPLIQDLGLRVFETQGPGAYSFTTGAPICNIGGEPIYPFIFAKMEKDSGLLDIRLQDLNGGNRDTVLVKLYRRK
jgi:hypothetical protein